MKKTKLNILWTNDNPVTAELMVFLYGINAKKRGWWDEVTLIIWGATAELVHQNEKIQNLVKEAIAEDVQVFACRFCAEKLGTVATLESLGAEVILMGEPLTQILQDDEKLITI